MTPSDPRWKLAGKPTHAEVGTDLHNLIKKVKGLEAEAETDRGRKSARDALKALQSANELLFALAIAEKAPGE